MKNVYLLLIGLLLVSVSSCKKSSVPGNVTGNDTAKVTNPTGVDVPAGDGDGVTFINSGKSVVFNLYAPGKKSVSVIGDFNNWTPTAMKNSKDGTRWWVQIDNIDPSTEYAYQYYIDGSLKVADPYSHKILDPDNDPSIPTTVYPNLKPYPTGKTTGIVTSFEVNAPAYAWKNATFTRPDQKNLVIYELLPRDFVTTHSYQEMTDSLDYIAKLGVNAIELMPINEFEGNDSWGYNSNFMFALDKYYGTPNAYKAFIDACHTRGIAVIQDIVLEDQFGSSPMVRMYATSTDPSAGPAANNPWFDQTNMHPDAVGWQLNHQSAATQYFTENVMKYWMQEYHIDGYRFDEAKGYTQTNSGNDETAWAAFDQSRVDLWTKYNTYMKGLDPSFYVILEMFSVNQEEAVYSNLGMMVWTNLSSPGEQATMGYPTNPSWDLSGLFYDGYGFPKPYSLVAYFESHDQERLQYKNTAYGNDQAPPYTITDLATGLKRDEMGAAFMFSSPGPKMVWQYGELGYDKSIDYPTGTDASRTADKPILSAYKSDPNRKELFSVYKKMINMKIKNAVFATTNFSYSLGGSVKTITLLDQSANVVVVGNFDIITQTNVTVNFPAAGTWYDNLNGGTINVASTAFKMTLAPGEYHVFSNTLLNQ
jgi:glycosidase